MSYPFGTLLVIEEMIMAAADTSSTQLSAGFADAYQMARRSMFEAAARVLRYHATVSDLKRARPATTASTAEPQRSGSPGDSTGA